MLDILKNIPDPKLKNIGRIKIGDQKKFDEMRAKYSAYDASFLWLLSYEGAEKQSQYINEVFKKFHKILDSGFAHNLSLKGNFDSRMWEMILCDILSKSGVLQEKKAKGPDFILKPPTNNYPIQIEAVAPNESRDKNLHAIKPDYSNNKFFEHGGLIHDLELPIVLRVLQAFNDKKEGYSRKAALILAINSSKAVGTVSSDDYILRRILFGLGNQTITKNGKIGFEQLPYFNKPGGKPFPVAYFRKPEYKHISGVIYTSQSPLGFAPGGYSWSNSGITFVPNPIASHPVKIEFPFFRKILCNEEMYREVPAKKEFIS